MEPTVFFRKFYNCNFHTIEPDFFHSGIATIFFFFASSRIGKFFSKKSRPPPAYLMIAPLMLFVTGFRPTVFSTTCTNVHCALRGLSVLYQFDLGVTTERLTFRNVQVLGRRN